MINQEQIAAYREMAKNASANGMEAQIRANLESTCDKFAGNEDKFDRCIDFLKKVCLEMLGGEDADEDREKTEDMKPTAEAQTVLEKWLKDFGKDAVKAMKKVA